MEYANNIKLPTINKLEKLNLFKLLIKFLNSCNKIF